MKKIKNILLKKKVLIPISIFAVSLVLVSTLGLSKVLAETYSGGTDNGLTSRIKTISVDLIVLGYGSTSDSPDWGALWNRIKTAAKWTPSGNAGVTDVKANQSFYSNNRSQQTGTYPAPGPCSTQQYHDSYGAPVTQTTNCTNTITWGIASPAVAGDDTGTGIKNQDPRTGLIWSQYLKNNAGTVAFVASGGSDWSWDGTTDADSIAVGSKTAKLLCSERGNGWRLPTQKELMQAYIDGSFFNLSNPSSYFWSATETSSTYAWYVLLTTGATNNLNKSTTSNSVRCVR